MQNTSSSIDFSKSIDASLAKLSNLNAKSALDNYIWHRSSQNELFGNILYFMKEIELGRLKVPTSPSSEKIVNKLQLLIATIQELMRRGPIPSDFSLNPYIEVFAEQVQKLPQIMHWWLYPESLIDRFQTALHHKRAGLKARQFKEKINFQPSNQIKVFNRLMLKHELLNCYFLEIPLATNNGVIQYPPLLEVESLFPRLLKKFFLKLHRASEFEKKLCDIQWRIVKGIDGVLIAHIVIYVPGEADIGINYFRQLWQETCLSEAPDIKNNTLYIHDPLSIYKEHVVAKKTWKDMIKSYHKSLEYYFYKNKKISFEWSAYTGNI